MFRDCLFGTEGLPEAFEGSTEFYILLLLSVIVVLSAWQVLKYILGVLLSEAMSRQPGPQWVIALRGRRLASWTTLSQHRSPLPRSFCRLMKA